MSNIIPNIESLKKVVKINASIPWEAVEPYIADALDIYIAPQVGDAVIVQAEAGTDQQLTEKILRALGPLTLALATDEMGIQYGDRGITVENEQGKRSPANEAKIAAAKQNLFYRGMQALDRLLEYLSRNLSAYPDYAEHLNATVSVRCFIRSAEELQNEGMVNVDYSTLTYRIMLPTLRQLQECTVRRMLGESLYATLLSGKELTAKHLIVRSLVIRLMANKAAELYTSQTGRSQRADNGNRPEYMPVIRPLYIDREDTGNWFAAQAAYYAGEIASYLTANAEALGIATADTSLNYNKKENKIFTSIA